MFHSVRPPNSLERAAVGRSASTLGSSNFVFLRKTSHDFYFAALQRIWFRLYSLVPAGVIARQQSKRATSFVFLIKQCPNFTLDIAVGNEELIFSFFIKYLNIHV